MTKRTSLLQALVLLLPLFAIAARGEEQIQAPVFKEGDFWQFQITSKFPPNFSPANEPWNGIYIVRYANGAIRLRKLVNEKPVPYGQGGILNFLGFRQGRRETLQFPLYLGKQWRYSFKGVVTNTVNLEVVTEERVATQAGIFPALKIEETLQYSIANPRWGTGITPSRGTYFYSPEAKTIVKYDYEADNGYKIHIELLKFGLTAPSKTD